MHIRDCVIDDVPAFCQIRKELFPWVVASLAAQETWFRTAPPAGRPLRLAAEVDGQVVAMCFGSLSTTTSEQGAASVNLAVRPAYQGRGIGSALWERMEPYLRSIGAKRTQILGMDGEQVQKFAVNRGFERGASLRYSFVDTAALPPVPATAAGVTLATAAEIGPDVLYALDTTASIDEPNDIPFDAMSKDEWIARVWGSPDLSLDASIVALVDGVAATATFIEVNPRTGRGWAMGTATLREYRGRGLSKLAKSVSLRKARELGVTHSYTCNDYSNAPMLAVNDWLGYEVMATQWTYLKDLSC